MENKNTANIISGDESGIEGSEKDIKGRTKSKASALRKILLVIGVLAIIMGIVIVIYISTYYRADALMLKDLSEELKGTNDSYSVFIGDDNELVVMPDEAKAGIIFYPGGKVQYEAYYPLMRELARDGYLCILLKVTANLAILDINAADGYIEQYSEIDSWYLAGHSLGGAVASMYADEHSGEYDGLILLGSYSTEDLSGDVDAVLSIYGSNDQVLAKDKYDTNKDNLPELTEYILDGGCHAYFGCYGEQKGDGEPAISRDEQIEQTAEYIDLFIMENLIK